LGRDTALVDNQALFQGSMMSSSSRTHWCIMKSQQDRVLMAVATQNWYLWIMLNLYGMRSCSCLNFLQFIFCVESYKCHSTVCNSEVIPDPCVGHYNEMYCPFTVSAGFSVTFKSSCLFWISSATIVIVLSLWQFRLILK
jgi:hypothetical protein